MTYVPLTVTWPNEDTTVVSSRVAVSYALPQANEDATVRILDGSFVNETHWVSTYLCEGCSQWDLGANPGELDPSGENVVGWAYSDTAANNPESEDSTFSMHDAAILFYLEFASAQSPDFEEWAGEVPPEPTPTTSGTTTSATLTPTSPPIPSEPVRVPSNCGETSLFPLEAADGWSFVKLAGDLTTPRGIAIDGLGSLLLVEAGSGLSAHTFGSDGCIAGSKTLIERRGLTHGVALAPGGRTLYVSSIDTVWKYDYDPETQTVSNEKVVVANMFPSSHSTRTLLVPPDTPDLLVVSLGSDGNLDMPAVNKEVGRAIVKVFDMAEAPEDGYDYSTQGWFLGYGLRNEVGLTTDNNNMVWGVENSADEFSRTIDGEEYDIHENNPSDEVNFLGDPSVSNENWYGYPTCFTVWGGDEFPGSQPPATGAQFIPAPNDTFTDATCEARSVAPRLNFQAHSAPLDAKFDREGSNMYVSLHGSWNREVPTGYKVVSIPFTTNDAGEYEPVAAPDSKDGFDNILWDPQEDCNSSKCFRPSGLSWDLEYTRLFIASDNSREGELYILYKTG
ncbi:carbohydrate-binding cytochrome b562 [Emericellopsis atlantica]|uniref:Carbohydrate-binding cytochrome b562 n=1 Tax=Emericellopsis atlantica TaxID=2614577 RepID=A0A9P7ZLJ1_9HYPO|nr:carbohydrate-binding cytochrome b562 [Emericellopsis atlantica]KAG9253713.1 carbohydrate-binding cytochrome b562 [Emericellopsis atlantica]